MIFFQVEKVEGLGSLGLAARESFFFFFFEEGGEENEGRR